MGDAATARNHAVTRMRAEGLTLQEIGRSFGISRERVRQILKTAGGPNAKDASAARLGAKATATTEKQSILRKHLENNGACTAKEAAEALDISSEEVRRLWPPDLRQFLVVVNPASTRWSDSDVHQALMHAATYDYPLRKNSYDELLRSGEVVGPSSVRLLQRFGTWREACHFAGIEAGQAPRESYESKWTDDDLLNFVRLYLMDPQERGTYAKYDQWRRVKFEDAPSSATLRNRLGQWSSIKRRALP